MQHYNISEATDAASALSDSRSWGCLRLLRSPPRSPSVRSVSKRAHSARHRSSGDIPTPGTTTMPGMGTSTNTGELPSVTITLTVVGIRTGRALIATIMERTAAATRMAARGTVTIMAPETIAAGTARKGIAMAARRTTRGHDHGHGHAHGEGGHAHGVETENLFGFTLGSDTEEAGAKGVALENVGRIGKRGTYRGLGQKLEASFGATNDLSLSFSLLGDYHRLRNVPDFEDVSGRYAANGVGAEVRWRFLDRKTAPFGLTLHLEPSVARIDEVSGQAGRKLGSENKLIFDRELIPNTLFGAINLLYDVERMKERHNNFVAERAANAGSTRPKASARMPQRAAAGSRRSSSRS